IYSIEEPTEIVVLPEMFSTGFSMRPSSLAETMQGSTVDWMKRISRDKRIILTGSLIIEEDGKFFNRLIWMMPNGSLGYYDKRHLFGFAGEDQHYHAGNKRLIASVKGWKLNLQICYDLRFPVWSRQQMTETPDGTEPEYDVLIYVANWPQRRSHAWKTLLCARAIENQCYVVGVNRVGVDGNDIPHSGDSLVLNPMGEVLYHMANDEDIFTIHLDKQELTDIRAKLPFLKDADRFHIQP
ncbi:MAG TPA: nitrilase family protein, partial [Chitinophagaceae bacterium]|nr:nitrilase family protein [Chitinophagaceae bacterium]